MSVVALLDSTPDRTAASEGRVKTGLEGRPARSSVFHNLSRCYRPPKQTSLAKLTQLISFNNKHNYLLTELTQKKNYSEMVKCSI